MKIPRPYLILFNPIYWLITFLRNTLFDIGLIRSTYYEKPIIAIGNLSTGGTGKTPHTEYIVKFLREKYQVAVLSRGYRRKSRGYKVAGRIPLANMVGDEPAQIKRKFPDITVAVDANRVHGINRLYQEVQQPEVIILDDAFQHRRLQAGIYILLTDYSRRYTSDMLLPAGNLRESRSGADRANIIVVTKCPDNMNASEMKKIEAELNPRSHQEVFFTRINYGSIVGDLPNLQHPFLLVTGIARADQLVGFLNKSGANYEHVNFPDHHHFNQTDRKEIIEKAKSMGVDHILTTEKDFQRLPIEEFEHYEISLSYIPIAVSFVEHEAVFQRNVTEYISAYM